MGASLGAARDTNIIQHQLTRGQKPSAKSIVYDGVFNEHYLKASNTKELLEPFGHCAVDRWGNLHLGIEVVSVLDGMPRPSDSLPLDVILVVDVSVRCRLIWSTIAS